ncbi:MAG: hypothetical protein IPG99_10245 [Ignavibacteria bacterium]|nr:hypothetical protein [Ignavibacteria bacterium]
MNGSVLALAVIGNTLFAGGEFITSGGAITGRIANGTVQTGLLSGADSTESENACRSGR